MDFCKECFGKKDVSLTLNMTVECRGLTLISVILEGVISRPLALGPTEGSNKVQSIQEILRIRSE